MITGLLAGITWALATVILGIALAASPFISSQQAIFLAPFAGTFLHDACSAVIMFIYNLVKGNRGQFLQMIKSRDFKWLLLASAIGGPVGMTGYVMTVNYMGASVGAVASAVYPAVGTVLAYFFLKEKVRWYQWIFLILALAGVYGLGYSPQLQVKNWGLGLAGALMCSFGWGIEAVVLAKCFKNTAFKQEQALFIRQTTSALLYGTIIIPALSGWQFTGELLRDHAGELLPVICCAAFFASLSYLLYYKAIAQVGAARAMALNITYTAWAIVFSVMIFKDFAVLNPMTLICPVLVVGGGILAAADFKTFLCK